MLVIKADEAGCDNLTYADLLSKRILDLIKERRWSVRTVSEAAGRPYSTVNKIVLKERENPSILTVHSIAMAFNMDIVEFLNFDEVRRLTKDELRAMRDAARRK